MKEWSSLEAESVVREALRARALRSPLELIHFTKTAVFALREEGLVAKVSRPGAPRETVSAGMKLASWLYDRGFPVPRPALEISKQPIQIENSLVHFWEWRGFAGKMSAPELGDVLFQFHKISADYPHRLPPLDPFGDIDRYLEIADLEKEDREALRAWRNHLRSRWPGGGELRSGPLHGNAHRGNTALVSGQAYLMDWDLACWGPREWDLLPETLGPRRYGRDRTDYQLFARSYGYDVLRWPGFTDAVLVRELLATLFRLVLDKGAGASSEGRRRLAFWRGQKHPPLWRGF